MPEQTKVSAAGAVVPAFNATKRILFEPFDFKKWLILGFCAFLSNLGQGGANGFNFHSPFGGGKSGPGPDKVLTWIQAHMALILVIAAGVLLLSIALGALLQWLASRGDFMFLDGVVKDRAEVVEPWKRFKDLGNNLFIFRFLLSLAGLAGLVLVGVLAWLMARNGIEARKFDGGVIAAIIVGGLLLLVLVVVLLVINLLLRDFVIPIMYKRGVYTLVAFRMLRTSLLENHVGAFIIFYLLKLALSILTGVVVTIVTCATCCIAALPYVSSVVFLPVFVFMRCYSLYFLEQFGDAWRVMPVPEVPPPLEPPPEEKGDEPEFGT